MNVYLDTSALVKRYVLEEASEQVLELLARATVSGSALIAITELTSGLARARRIPALPRAAAEAARDLFLQDVGRYLWIQVDRALVEHAAELVWNHPLRAADALHLAAALRWARELADEELLVATFDQRLAEAARAEGLNVWP